ncbi:MAG: HAD hydrolase-like protein [bacterium]|nr:HAD hydrolase-like protein [bacterium]
MKKKVSVVITDVDNTLYDWVGIWHASFGAMLECLVKQSGVARETLEREFKAVHQAHGTSEYAFSIEELPSLRNTHGRRELPDAYDECKTAYRRARDTVLRLYPSVFDTLVELRDRGCLLVAYTESKASYTRYRMTCLDLDLLFHYLYSPPGDAIPEGQSRYGVHCGPDMGRDLRVTRQRYTPANEVKPNPGVLRAILDEVGADPEQAVYVGDDLVKDISMARDVGITAIWAKYGTAHNRPEYELLKKVTHWKQKEVLDQKEASVETVQPSYVLKADFGELLDVIEPEAFVQRGAARPRPEHLPITAGLVSWKDRL